MASADAVIAALRAKRDRVAATLVVNLTSALAVVTPKDTTNASRCWIPSVGAPVLLAKADPTRQGAAPAQLVGAGVAVGSKFYVSNGAGYIRLLNGGSSQQEPAGFVQREIAKATQELRP